MSRSYRHVPVLKGSPDTSNREFKVEAHQHFRRSTKQAIRRALDDIGEGDPEWPVDTEAVFPQHMKEVSQLWCSKQEHRYTEFGNFWKRTMDMITSDLVTRPYYTRKRAEQDMKWAKKWYRKIFRK